MVSRFLSFVCAALLLVSAAGFWGCAGSKSSSGSGSGGDDKAQKLEDARKSAEDAEMKAHQLREEKNRAAGKPSPN
jgi:hypothetical protein